VVGCGWQSGGSHGTSNHKAGDNRMLGVFFDHDGILFSVVDEKPNTVVKLLFGVRPITTKFIRQPKINPRLPFRQGNSKMALWRFSNFALLGCSAAGKGNSQ
jgi:hypothetical protein